MTDFGTVSSQRDGKVNERKMRQEKGGEGEGAGTGVIRDRGRRTVVHREEK